MAAHVGQKVLIAGRDQDGFAEVVSYPDSRDTVEVAYFLSPIDTVPRRVPVRELTPAELPSQTRCYYKDHAGFRIGRVLACVPSPQGSSYHVRFPNDQVLLLPETEFHVRSYLSGGDPVATLSSHTRLHSSLSAAPSGWAATYARFRSRGVCAASSPLKSSCSPTKLRWSVECSRIQSFATSWPMRLGSARR